MNNIKLSNANLYKKAALMSWLERDRIACDYVKRSGQEVDVDVLKGLFDFASQLKLESILVSVGKSVARSGSMGLVNFLSKMGVSVDAVIDPSKIDPHLDDDDMIALIENRIEKLTVKGHKKRSIYYNITMKMFGQMLNINLDKVNKAIFKNVDDSILDKLSEVTFDTTTDNINLNSLKPTSDEVNANTETGDIEQPQRHPFIQNVHSVDSRDANVDVDENVDMRSVDKHDDENVETVENTADGAASTNTVAGGEVNETTNGHDKHDENGEPAASNETDKSDDDEKGELEDDDGDDDDDVDENSVEGDHEDDNEDDADDYEIRTNEIDMRNVDGDEPQPQVKRVRRQAPEPENVKKKRVSFSDPLTIESDQIGPKETASTTTPESTVPSSANNRTLTPILKDSSNSVGLLDTNDENDNKDDDDNDDDDDDEEEAFNDLAQLDDMDDMESLNDTKVVIGAGAGGGGGGGALKRKANHGHLPQHHEPVTPKRMKKMTLANSTKSKNDWLALTLNESSSSTPTALPSNLIVASSSSADPSSSPLPQKAELYNLNTRDLDLSNVTAAPVKGDGGSIKKNKLINFAKTNTEFDILNSIEPLTSVKAHKTLIKNHMNLANIGLSTVL